MRTRRQTFVVVHLADPAVVLKRMGPIRRVLVMALNQGECSIPTLALRVSAEELEREIQRGLLTARRKTQE